MNNRTKELSKEWPIIFVVDELTVCDLLGFNYDETPYLPLETSGMFQSVFIRLVVVDALTNKKNFYVMFKQEDYEHAIMFRLTYPCERVYAPTGI